MVCGLPIHAYDSENRATMAVNAYDSERIDDKCLGERRFRNYRAICARFAIVANISGRNSTADRLIPKLKNARG
jgi:hypothetical protein